MKFCSPEIYTLAAKTSPCLSQCSLLWTVRHAWHVGDCSAWRSDPHLPTLVHLNQLVRATRATNNDHSCPACRLINGHDVQVDSRDVSGHQRYEKVPPSPAVTHELPAPAHMYQPGQSYVKHGQAMRNMDNPYRPIKTSSREARPIRVKPGLAQAIAVLNTDNPREACKSRAITTRRTNNSHPVLQAREAQTTHTDHQGQGHASPSL